MTEPIDPNMGQPTWGPPQQPYWVPPAQQQWPGTPPQWVQGSEGAPVPAGWWPPAPPPPSHRGRNTLIAVLVAAVLVAASVGAYVVFGGNSSPNRLALPSAFDGYSRLENSNSDRVEQMMRSMGSGAGLNGMFDAASIGAYAYDSGDLPRLIVFLVPTAKVPASAGGSPDEVVSGLVSMLGPSVGQFPPGPHGGAMRCGNTQFGTVAELMCGWSDSATTGLLVSVLRPISVVQLAAIALDFRDTVD